VDAMAEYCLELLRDEATLKQFGRAARKRAADFDYRTIVPQYEAVYQRVLAAPVKTARAS